MADPVLVRAVFKFKGSNNDELKFKKGDVITITQREDGGWWEGTLDGKTGWFPSNYVEEMAKEANNVALVPDPVPEEVIAQNIDYRQQVLRDLLEKEQEFVQDLRGLLNQYLQPLRHADILTDAEYVQLVGNLEELIEAHQRLNSTLEDVRRGQPRQQRLGQVFLSHGAALRGAHLAYWANHPRAVCVLERHRERLNSWLDSVAGGGTIPGLMLLTTGLSRPFRQLERLAGTIQEVEQHLEDDHVDKGDTQRSIGFYKEVAAEAARSRRQKEDELEVLTGTVRGWEGEPLEQLGEILKMGTVVTGQGAAKKDKKLVLFPSTLLILSVSNRLSAFIYEGKLPLSGLSVTRPEGETEASKNSFEISGPMIETILCSCASRLECQEWQAALAQQVRAARQSCVLPSKLPGLQPLPPPHKTGVGLGPSPATRSPRTGLASRGQGQGVQGWKMTCLRPAPPTRSFQQAVGQDKRNTLRRKEVEQSSYEDDLQILRVIEAYCTSKQRQTITNSVMLDTSTASSAPLSLADAPSGLEDSFLSAASSSRVDRLEREVASLARRLDSEERGRRRLHELLGQAGIPLPPDISDAAA